MAQVLVIDDEPYNVRIVELYLEDVGHEVLSAGDGTTGWELLEKHADTLDVILLDRMMPIMDGMQFMEKLRSHPDYARIPVIMQTASAEKEQVAEGIRAGVYYYLTKPYEEHVLLSIVTAAINDYGDVKKLRNELQKYKNCFGMTTHSTREFSTLEECRDLVPFIASFFPDPERVAMGISELFINAIEHGNLGITYHEKTTLNADNGWETEVRRRLALPEYAGKKVRAEYEKRDDVIKLTIRDEGDGFRWEDYLEIKPERASDNHGRGIALSRMMSFDRLAYLGNGNEVVCTILLED